MLQQQAVKGTPELVGTFTRRLDHMLAHASPDRLQGLVAQAVVRVPMLISEARFLAIKTRQNFGLQVDDVLAYQETMERMTEFSLLEHTEAILFPPEEPDIGQTRKSANFQAEKKGFKTIDLENGNSVVWP